MQFVYQSMLLVAIFWFLSKTNSNFVTINQLMRHINNWSNFVCLVR
jgi:hypothetical protein